MFAAPHKSKRQLRAPSAVGVFVTDCCVRDPRIESAVGRSSSCHFNSGQCLFNCVVCVMMLELLDKTDRSLSFAAFGAAQYNSFPVAVFPVASSRHSTEELLLCFDGLCHFCAFIAG